MPYLIFLFLGQTAETIIWLTDRKSVGKHFDIWMIYFQAKL